MPHRTSFFASLFLAACLLAACGGGGGGGGGSSPPSAAVKSGLIPVAPTAGEVLEADAAALRVLRPAAVWTYHGVDVPYGNQGLPTIYTNVVTHTGAPVGVSEHSSNLFNSGADVSNVQAAAGTVKVPGTVQPVSGIGPDAIDGLELRSPVRTDDLYAIYDKHFDDGGQDFDGDGIHESLDVAIWARVVGAEVVDLAHRRQVRAIRVDTTLNERVLYSKSGTYSNVVEIVRRTWYAKGIGIVKMQLDQPGPNIPSVRQVTTEVLDTWDGLTEGVGYLPVQTAVPGSTMGSVSISAPIGAAAFDDHAVVMSYIPDAILAEGVRFTMIDFKGRVLSSVDQHGMNVASQRFLPNQLLRVGGELRLIVTVNDGLALLGFDATGNSLTRPLTMLLPGAAFAANADGQTVQAAAVGSRIWLMWLSPNVDAQGNSSAGDLKLQQFDASGTPIGSPSILEGGIVNGALRSIQLSAASDRTIATWGIGSNTGGQRYAVADSASGALITVKSLLPAAPAQTGYPFYYGLQPLALGSGLALAYLSDSSSGAVAGVELDASFDPIRSVSGTLGNEVLSQSWTLPTYYPALTATGLGRIWIGIDGSAKLWPEDSQATPVQQLSELTPGAGALASTGSLKLLAQVPDFRAYFVLPYSDRLLVFGTRSTDLVTTVVWRQP
jgi:hypothetical protein